MSTLCVCFIRCLDFRMSRLKDDDIENLHAQIKNGDISEDEKDMGDLNKIDYYPDLQEFINEIDDNNDDEEDNENTSSTMEEKSLDPFNNPRPSNHQPQSNLLGVAVWGRRRKELI
ncbi:unnamed protein product [Euphydryas editha]|uniref:Uncharacterized protein n=1 Tax=Euphydryas editha TaxID=104508 RepID=A0AAU9UVP8_EUPED|nr:unnamed protein product [Euphydryas editha]